MRRDDAARGEKDGTNAMRQTWRWFGPPDVVTIDDILEAGAEGVVTALHHAPPGVAWTAEEIAKRQAEVATRRDGAPSGLLWEVAESLPVSEEIKRRDGDWRLHVDAYKTSLRRLAAAGVKTVCYNFMPLLDWTRTDLAWRLPRGGACMRFDYLDFAAFELFILERRGAVYPEDVAEDARRRFAAMDETAASKLVGAVLCGLPGERERMTLDALRERLAAYAGLTREKLRGHLIDFLGEVAPVAEGLGVRLCCHPDDPPFDLLGLPRVVSTEADYRAILDAVDLDANGVTLCSGSLGANPANDPPGMMERLGPRVHFLHLRNVRRESAGFPGSFHESEHLDGDVDMPRLIFAVLAEEARRRAEGRSDCAIPMRPDHGHDLLDDHRRGGQPGYGAVGRLRGLAELRGVAKAFQSLGPSADAGAM